MSSELTNTNDWRKAVEDEAQCLEAGAGLMRFLAMADDQVDAIRVASDLMAAAWHCDKARAARMQGQAAPNPPIPVSKLLTRFAESVREKLGTSLLCFRRSTAIACSRSHLPLRRRSKRRSPTSSISS